MLKAFKTNVLIFLTLCLIFTSGCKQKYSIEKSNEDIADVKSQTIPINEGIDNVELEIWGWFDMEKTIAGFESENGIEVKQKILPFDDCNKEYMKAIANGTGPDVFVFDSDFFGKYTVDNILQNLLEEPFVADKYKNDFLGWESGYSVDNTQLLSISYSTAPYITMYREDILKENGFPSEPHELGKFIETSDNLLKIAEKLKEQNKYIFQNSTDITDIVCSTMGYFDNELNYIREGELFERTIDMAQQMYNNDLISNKSFWHDTGKKAIQEEKLVMLFLPSYAMINLEKYVPEQKGKWRVAAAPLGVAAWGTDTRLSINKQSKHKEEAWELIKHIVTSVGRTKNVVPSYIPALSDEAYLSQNKDFFGDQKIYPILTELAKNMTQYKLTPLDEMARIEYLNGMWKTLVFDFTAYEEIEKMKKEVEKEVAQEKAMLLK